MDTALSRRAERQSTPEARVPHLAPLTGLRWLAATLVIAHHFGPYPSQWAQASQGHGLAAIASRIALSGFVGVDLFFVLSGFILSYSYADARGALRTARRDFWAARVARIYPVYLLATLLAAPAFLARQPAPAPPLLAGLLVTTLTQAWVPATASVWNPPAWSLSAEALFYVLFPLVASFCARVPLRRIPLWCLACWLACLAIPLAYLAHPGASLTWVWVIVYNPLLRLPEFLLGALAGRAFVLLRSRDGKPSALKVPRGTAEACLIGCAVALAASSEAMRPFLRNGGLDLLFALLIYALAARRGLLSAFFAWRGVRLLGEASYAMFILHWPLWDALTALLHVSTAQGRSSWPFALVYLGLVMAVSVLVHWTSERPARTWLRVALASRRPPDTAAAPAYQLAPVSRRTE